MNTHFDVAVIGGGIVGLAHAWMAAKRGLRVTLMERSTSAHGASTRNFGMIWPIGQPAGERYSLAMRSRDLWLELQELGVVSAEPCGSIHAAHHADELAVLEEFCDRQSHQARLLRPDEVVKRSHLVNPDGLAAGMYSPTELRVDPRRACAQIAKWLSESHGVECSFETLITRIEDGMIHSADGRNWRAERIIVCGGSDLHTLYAGLLKQSGLQICKLQMLKTHCQPTTHVPTPHIASGLTLRHYDSFRDCPSCGALEDRIRKQSPELDRFGIHVMASQRICGDVILGDSHEYGADVSSFDSVEIDELIVRELTKVIRLDNWTIQERWHGFYAKHPELPVFETVAADGVHIFTGTGGAGMTLAFGLADQAWQRWE